MTATFAPLAQSSTARHVRFARGNGDEVRRVGEVAVRGANRLGIRLSVGVQEPLIGIGCEHVGNRAGRRHTRCAQADVRHLRRGDEAGFDAKTISEEAEQPLPLRFVEARVLHAPAIELQAATHCYHLRVTALALIITNAMGNCNFMGPAYCVCGHDWSGPHPYNFCTKVKN